MDPEEKEKMEKRDWLAEKIQMLNTQLEGFEADVEKAVSLPHSVWYYFERSMTIGIFRGLFSVTGTFYFASFVYSLPDCVPELCV